MRASKPFAPGWRPAAEPDSGSPFRGRGRQVLEGSLLIGDDLVVHAGGFHLAHGNTLHAPITSRLGATIFLCGASPQIADLF